MIYHAKLRILLAFQCQNKDVCLGVTLIQTKNTVTAAMLLNCICQYAKGSKLGNEF